MRNTIGVSEAGINLNYTHLNELLTVIFEDDCILAVEKPSGLPSHSLTPDQTSCESILKSMRPADPFHLVHRLDTGTSGVLLFAKSEVAFNKMREIFKAKQIRKHYVAWTRARGIAKSDFEGNATEIDRLKILQGLTLPQRIEWDLAHHPKSKKRMIALPPDKRRQFRGKPIPALTFVRGFRAEKFLNVDAIRIEVEIVTGVMHQIRVHLASLGLPLIGDTIYEKAAEEADRGEENTRMALHAERIAFHMHGFQYEISSSYVCASTKAVDPGAPHGF